MQPTDNSPESMANQIIRMDGEGMSHQEIADALGYRTTQYIRTVLLRNRRYAGTAAQIAEIREMCAEILSIVRTITPKRETAIDKKFKSISRIPH